MFLAIWTALEQRTFEASVLSDERDAQLMGLSGVPAFVADRRAAATGVQTVEGLKELLDYVRSGALDVNK